MPRYIKSKRTSSGTSSEEDRLRDQFLKDLTQQAQTIMKQMQQEFSQDLQQQSSQILGLLNGEGNASGAGLGSIFSTASRFFFSRPRTRTSTRESTRSHEETDRFRLSQSQLMAEASEAMSRGDKNL